MSKKTRNRAREASAAADTELRSTELDSAVLSQLASALEACVEKALAERRTFLVHELADRLAGLIQPPGPVALDSEDDTRRWVRIESLSALRSFVGGRFHNLKTKWVEAGLPLKEHRGEKVQSVEVERQGWLELTNWISKQGFEVRLAPDKAGCLFELRPAPKG